VLAQDNAGTLHVVWFSTEAENVNGRVQPQALLDHSSQQGGNWTTPTIVGRTGLPTQPELVADGDGRLHMVWTSHTTDPNALTYASFTPYNCDDYPLSGRDIHF
jgi:hypothetical protein